MTAAAQPTGEPMTEEDIIRMLGEQVKWHEEQGRPYSAGVDRDAIALIECLRSALPQQGAGEGGGGVQREDALTAGALTAEKAGMPDDLVAAYERSTALRCWTRINDLIVKGPLPGNGLDKSAERNGLILATNVIFDLAFPEGADVATEEQVRRPSSAEPRPSLSPGLRREVVEFWAERLWQAFRLGNRALTLAWVDLTLREPDTADEYRNRARLALSSAPPAATDREDDSSNGDDAVAPAPTSADRSA